MEVRVQQPVPVDLHARIDQLEARLRIVTDRSDQLETELATAVERSQSLERELATERELRRSIEEAAQLDGSLVETIRHLVDRHSTALEAATVRHEQAILNLVSQHRNEVSDRLDLVLRQNTEMFKRITDTIQDVWTNRGTTRPSLDKEHWFLLAREDEEDPDGDNIVSFRIHSGQRSYIDRIGKNKNVIVASPAANGVDIRQTAKKRMRELLGDQDDIEIDALKFSCSNPDKLDGFFAFLAESIEYSLAAPRMSIINRLQQEASQNLRQAFNLEGLFQTLAVAA